MVLSPLMSELLFRPWLSGKTEIVEFFNHFCPKQNIRIRPPGLAALAGSSEYFIQTESKSNTRIDQCNGAVKSFSSGTISSQP